MRPSSWILLLCLAAPLTAQTDDARFTVTDYAFDAQSRRATMTLTNRHQVPIMRLTVAHQPICAGERRSGPAKYTKAWGLSGDSTALLAPGASEPIEIAFSGRRRRESLCEGMEYDGAAVLFADGTVAGDPILAKILAMSYKAQTDAYAQWLEHTRAVTAAGDDPAPALRSFRDALDEDYRSTDEADFRRAVADRRDVNRAIRRRLVSLLQLYRRAAPSERPALGEAARKRATEFVAWVEAGAK